LILLYAWFVDIVRAPSSGNNEIVSLWFYVVFILLGIGMVWTLTKTLDILRAYGSRGFPIYWTERERKIKDRLKLYLVLTMVLLFILIVSFFLSNMEDGFIPIEKMIQNVQLGVGNSFVSNITVLLKMIGMIGITGLSSYTFYYIVLFAKKPTKHLYIPKSQQTTQIISGGDANIYYNPFSNLNLQFRNIHS
jgi:hypothetical protein